MFIVQMSANYLHWSNSNWSEPYLIAINSAGTLIENIHAAVIADMLITTTAFYGCDHRPV